MKLIRSHIISKIFSMFIGVVFLNMSFFLAEVSMLKFDKSDMIENIAKLIFNGGTEEERDTESSRADTVAKEVDVLLQQVQIHQAASVFQSSVINRTIVDHYLHANFSLSFYPPPDHFTFS